MLFPFVSFLIVNQHLPAHGLIIFLLRHFWQLNPQTFAYLSREHSFVRYRKMGRAWQAFTLLAVQVPRWGVLRCSCSFHPLQEEKFSTTTCRKKVQLLSDQRLCTFLSSGLGECWELVQHTVFCYYPSFELCKYRPAMVVFEWLI